MECSPAPAPPLPPSPVPTLSARFPPEVIASPTKYRKKVVGAARGSCLSHPLAIQQFSVVCYGAQVESGSSLSLIYNFLLRAIQLSIANPLGDGMTRSPTIPRFPEQAEGQLVTFFARSRAELGVS